ncbi:hypothetical protein BDZ94DRAFT_1256454 [Collybia nuda]|uniref:DUF6533 domain-containing protein n=1 Tax=Collybia nuda TaxID=64659 RepID=A0A9P5Y969_9AGAR|nr:hypothetical protein BDZ94DRAFT_1256454 [Collybia nuda]
MSESPAELIAKFTVAVSENQRAVAAVVAALTFCTYDIVLSFPQEVKYIWRSKQSLITMLYFFVRYYSLINIICKGYYVWSVAAVPCIHLLAVDMVLLLRIFALYDRSKLVLTVLASLVFGECNQYQQSDHSDEISKVDLSVNQWANASLAKELIRGIAVVPPPYLGCATQVPSLKYNLISYILNFTLSLIFLAMTLKKLVENIQRLYGKLTWKSYKNVVAFAHDGSMFFALYVHRYFDLPQRMLIPVLESRTSATLLFEMIALFGVGGPIQVAITPWHLAMYSYSCSHLILNLRARGNSDQTWTETLSIQYTPRDDTGIQLGESLRFS